MVNEIDQLAGRFVRGDDTQGHIGSAEGRILVAYNVLDSYALARADIEDVLTVILPSDFPTTIMRTALVSKSTSDPALAESFVSHLILLHSQRSFETFLLPSLDALQDQMAAQPLASTPR